MILDSIKRFFAKEQTEEETSTETEGQVAQDGQPGYPYEFGNPFFGQFGGQMPPQNQGESRDDTGKKRFVKKSAQAKNPRRQPSSPQRQPMAPGPRANMPGRPVRQPNQSNGPFGGFAPGGQQNAPFGGMQPGAPSRQMGAINRRPPLPPQAPFGFDPWGNPAHVRRQPNTMAPMMPSRQMPPFPRAGRPGMQHRHGGWL